MVVRINEVVGVGTKNYSGKYFVTSVNPEADIHDGLWSSMERYAKDTGAEIVLIPAKPHWRALSKKDKYYPEMFKDWEYEGNTLLMKQRLLNRKVRIIQEAIPSQKKNPITADVAEAAQNDVTTILASPKQFFEVVPNSNVDLPKIIMTTGSLTEPLYLENPIGKAARRHHELGGIVVEIVNDTHYHLRHVQATSAGDFVDLGVNYSPERKKKAVLEALIVGDTHVGDTDPKVREATYDMIDKLEPRRIVLHDFFNGHSINHHEWMKSATRAFNFAAKRTSLEEELQQCAHELKRYVESVPKNVQIYLVDCNHHDFLRKYLEKGDFPHDRENAIIAAKLFVEQGQGRNPVEMGIKMFYHTPKNVHFLKRDQDLKVRGWQLGSHGDLGANGAKNSPRTIERSNGKSITMHTHTPFKRRKVIIGGTSTYLQLPYNQGPSSWLNSHVMLYDTGKAQIVNMIDGKYRL